MTTAGAAAILAPAFNQGNVMADQSPGDSGAGGQLVSAACFAVIAVAVLAGVPLAMNQWRELSLARSQQALRDSHLREAAHHVRAGEYQLAATGYKRAGTALRTDPAVTLAADHLLVLSSVRSPGGLTGALLNEADYAVERALRHPYPPAHPEYYLTARGAVHAIRGRIEPALAAFEEAEKRAPDFGPARYFRGKVLADVGRPEEAVPELQRAIDLDPRNTFALKRLARIRKEAGALDEAAALLQQAIELGPNADAHFQLGLVYDLQRKHEDALRQFVAVGRLQRGYPNLGRNLGLTLFKLKRWQEAAKVLGKVFEQTRDINIYYYIGRSVMELGDRQQAANIFQTIVNNRPRHADARYDLARLLDQAGQSAQARGHYAAFLKAAEGRADLAAEVRFARQRLDALREVLSGTGR